MVPPSKEQICCSRAIDQGGLDVKRTTELNSVPGFSVFNDDLVEQVERVARVHRLSAVSLADVIVGLGGRLPGQAVRSEDGALLVRAGRGGLGRFVCHGVTISPEKLEKSQFWLLYSFFESTNLFPFVL